MPKLKPTVISKSNMKQSKASVTDIENSLNICQCLKLLDNTANMLDVCKHDMALGLARLMEFMFIETAHTLLDCLSEHSIVSRQARYTASVHAFSQYIYIHIYT